QRSGVASRTARYLLWCASRYGNNKELIVGTGGFYLVDVAGKCDLLPIRRDGIEVLAAEIEGRNIVISRRDVHGNTAFSSAEEQVAWLETCVGRPMPVKQAREDLGFHFRFSQFFVASLVAGIIFAVGIHLGDENDVLAVGCPHSAIGLS